MCCESPGTELLLTGQLHPPGSSAASWRCSRAPAGADGFQHQRESPRPAAPSSRSRAHCAACLPGVPQCWHDDVAPAGGRALATARSSPRCLPVSLDRRPIRRGRPESAGRQVPGCVPPGSTAFSTSRRRLGRGWRRATGRCRNSDTGGLVVDDLRSGLRRHRRHGSSSAAGTSPSAMTLVASDSTCMMRMLCRPRPSSGRRANRKSPTRTLAALPSWHWAVPRRHRPDSSSTIVVEQRGGDG